MKYFLIVIVFVLVGCSGLKEGEIYDKNYSPAHMQLIMMPIVHTISTDKTTSSFVTVVPMWFYFPDSWSLSYKAFNQKKNKWETATVWVNQQTFDISKIGMWYKKTEDDLDEQPRIETNK